MTLAKAHLAPTGWAQALGYAGLIPFVALALATCLLEPPDRARSLSALLAYSATILSFLGAIHWGLAMREATGAPQRMLIWGVAPSLLAWVALLLDAKLGTGVVAGGLWLCFVADRLVYPRLGLQAWLPMRLALTTVASLSCVVGAWAVTR
jgi:Protein of unknown function (DUF3429)